MKIAKALLLSAGFPAVFSLALLAGCSSESQPYEASEAITETVSETAAETILSENTETTESASETTSETEIITEETSAESSAITTVSEETSESTQAEPDTEAWAHNFAAAVFAELENNKTSDTPTVLTPMPMEVDDTDIFAGFESELFFLDVNFDGVPELFAGGHGQIGTGRYSIYAADGSSYGNDLFSYVPDVYSVYDNCIYASSGSNAFPGYVKLVPGLPQIHIDGNMAEEGNTVQIIDADGAETTLTDVSMEEYKALYSEYLGADYDALEDESNYASSEPCVVGTLRVPDMDNYSEEDIYNCIAPLLEEYMSALSN